MKVIVRQILSVAMTCGLAVSFTQATAGEDDWIELIGDEGLSAWRKPAGDWVVAGDARVDPKNARRLVPKPGRGVIVNGSIGRTRNLLTQEEFGDLEGHFEFLIPMGSNSGVKFQGLYEIQIFDSFGVAKPTANHNGGIYPRAKLLPRYHYLDEGVPPKVNASRAAGEWQTLDVVFRAPRFDASGKKIEDARFDKVVLNGQVIHDQVGIKTPTGHAWHNKEMAKGPILLQADHGPVAFREIRIRRRD